MDDTIDMLSWGTPLAWDRGQSVELPASLVAASGVVNRHLRESEAGWMLFWDPMLGAPPVNHLHDLQSGRFGDAWHGGVVLGLAGLPDEHDYIHPTTPFVLDPAPEVEGICWRLSLGAALIRSEALREVGGIDPMFHSATGAGIELGRRLISHGAIVRSSPEMVKRPGALAGSFDEHDRFLFLRRTFGRKWVHYAALRRALATRRPGRVFSGLAQAGRTHRGHPPLAAALVKRDEVAVDLDASVSVILPTLGRYELVEPLLAQLSAQTLRPLEILVVDQNDPSDRDPDLYRAYESSGVRVIWQRERGQWISRNAAIEQARGEYLVFIDDDSEVEPGFIAAHLEALLRYDADLSSGASLAVVGAPVPDNYGFFRVADQWDSGNGMCRRQLFERMGRFDEQFDRQRRGDAEFGLRVQLCGGLVIHVPEGIRIHLKAESGGLRSYGQWDGFRSKARSGPLPVPSMLYYTARYHTARQRREDLYLGLVQGVVPYHLKRQASGAQWLGFIATELIHLRSTVQRVRLSQRLAAEMVSEGPKIPRLDS